MKATGKGGLFQCQSGRVPESYEVDSDRRQENCCSGCSYIYCKLVTVFSINFLRTEIGPFPDFQKSQGGGGGGGNISLSVEKYHASVPGFTAGHLKDGPRILEIYQNLM